MLDKQCCICKQQKPIDDFSRNQKRADGRSTQCRVCNAKSVKAWKERHPDRKKASDKRWADANKARQRDRMREWRLANLDKKRQSNKAWADANPEKMKQAIDRWKTANPERVAEQNRRDCQRRRKNPKHRVRNAVGERIRGSLRGGKAGRSWETLVGFTLNDLYAHLETNFSEGMTWENYGHGKGKWTIDHKIPVSAFSFTTVHDDGFRQCWALSNLQPMWFEENSAKGNRQYRDAFEEATRAFTNG